MHLADFHLQFIYRVAVTLDKLVIICRIRTDCQHIKCGNYKRRHMEQAVATSRKKTASFTELSDLQS